MIEKLGRHSHWNGVNTQKKTKMTELHRFQTVAALQALPWLYSLSENKNTIQNQEAIIWRSRVLLLVALVWATQTLLKEAPN